MEEGKSDPAPAAPPPPATSASLDEAARLLAGVVTPRGAGGHEVAGALSGLAVNYSEVLGHSLIVVQSPAVLRDVLQGIVARDDLGALEVDGRLQIDVVPGDARYETMLLVDGAPREAASGLLDDVTRRWIRATRPGTFRIREEAGGTEVRVQVDQLDRASVARVLSLVTAFAAGLSERDWDDQPATVPATPAATAAAAVAATALEPAAAAAAGPVAAAAPIAAPAAATAPVPDPAPTPTPSPMATTTAEPVSEPAHHDPAPSLAHAAPAPIEDDGSAAAAAIFLIAGFLVLVAALMGLLII